MVFNFCTKRQWAFEKAFIFICRIQLIPVWKSGYKSLHIFVEVHIVLYASTMRVFREAWLLNFRSLQGDIVFTKWNKVNKNKSCNCAGFVKMPDCSKDFEIRLIAALAWVMYTLSICSCEITTPYWMWFSSLWLVHLRSNRYLHVQVGCSDE